MRDDAARLLPVRPDLRCRPGRPRAPPASRGAGFSRSCASCRSRSASCCRTSARSRARRRIASSSSARPRTNLSPGFMLYRDPARRARRARSTTPRPLAELLDADGVHHALAKVQPRRRRARHRRRRRPLDPAHRRRPPPLRDGAALLARRWTRRTPGASGARRAPLLHDVPRQRRRSGPRRVPDAPPRALARRRSRSTSSLRARRGDSSTSRRSPRGVDAGAALAALARRGRTGPSLAAAAADGRAALLTLRGDVDLGAHPTLAQRPGRPAQDRRRAAAHAASSRRCSASRPRPRPRRRTSGTRRTRRPRSRSCGPARETSSSS